MGFARTAIADTDKKIDIIDHVNDDHLAELLLIAQSYISPDITDARLKNIFQEGILLEITNTIHPHQKEGEVAFTIKGDIEEQIFYLAYDAMSRQGKSLDRGQKHYFEVKEKVSVTANMLRLKLTSSQPFTEDAPGFAWLFSLKVLQKKQSVTSPPKSLLKQWFNRLFVWSLRFFSMERRKKMMSSLARDIRYYTLRFVDKNSQQQTAWIDIYLHGDTAGSVWAESLMTGDIISSTSEHHEKTAHLENGQTLLIGDETALPTIAALLENWTNPIPPIAISITHHEKDQSYLSDIKQPEGSQIHYLSYINQTVADQVNHLIKQLPPIDNVWGALEAEEAKLIRKFLRDNYQLTGEQNRVKGYWKQK